MTRTPSMAPKSNLPRSQFNLRQLFYLTLTVGAGLGFVLGMIPNGTEEGSLFFFPTFMLGDASNVFAWVAIACSPILSMIITYKLIGSSPRPAMVWPFLAVFLLAVLQFVFARPWVSELVLRIETSVFIMLATGVVCEVITKKLRNHALTAGAVFGLALAFWFFAQFVVVVLLHV